MVGIRELSSYIVVFQKYAPNVTKKGYFCSRGGVGEEGKGGGGGGGGGISVV